MEIFMSGFLLYKYALSTLENFFRYIMFCVQILALNLFPLLLYLCIFNCIFVLKIMKFKHLVNQMFNLKIKQPRKNNNS